MALTRRKINSLYEEKETSAAKQEKLDRFRAGYLKDTSAALPETKNPPVRISAGGFTEQAGGDLRADLMQAADATRNAKSGNAAAAAIQGMSGYIGKNVEPKKEKDATTENIVFPVIPLSTASRANMVNAGLADHVVKPEVKATVPIMDAPVSLSLEAMNTTNKTTAGETLRNAQKMQETAVLPGVTRPYTQVEQMQERRRDGLREEKVNLQKRISGLELVKETIREQVAELGDEQSDSLEKNNREGDSVEQRGAEIVEKRKTLEDTIAQIDRATNRIREIDEILNTPRETDIHPLAYQVARVGVGAVETAENWASSLAYTLGDALTDGAFSDNQKKVSDYLAQNPALAEQLYTYTPSAAQRIANAAGVSVGDVEMFRKTTGAEYLREGLNSADNITAGMQAAGNIAETIGQMLPSILLTAGYTPANPSKPADGVAKFIASKITPAPGDAFIGASVYGGQLEAVAKERGFDVSNYLNAAANAAVETAIEKALGFSDAESFQRLFMPTGSTGKSVLKGIANYIVTGSGEGLEEVVNVPLSEIIDRMTGVSDRTNVIGEGGIFDVAEMAKSGLSGAAVGLIMGGVGGVAAVAGSVVESGNIRRGISELSELQKDLPESYRVEIPDAKKVTLDEFYALSAKHLENLERFKDDLAAGKVTMPEETPVQDTTPTAKADVPTAEDNATTETADVQTAKTEQNAPISEDVAKTPETVAKTEETAAISDEESIAEEDIETFDESIDEDSPVAKSLRIAETDVYTAGNELVNAYGGDVRKAVDALYAEGNRLVKDGSAEARAKLSTVEAVRSDILSNNAKRVERNASHLNKILTKYGIQNVTVDMELADGEERGYYDPATKTIHLSPKLSGSEAVNFVIAHELGHHAAAADSTIVNDIMNIMPKMVEKGIFSAERFSYNRYLGSYAQHASDHAASPSGQAELKAYMDSGMTKEQAVQRIVDDYIHQEMASDILGELAKNPDILKKLKREDRTLWQRIVDAVQDFLAKVSGKVETREQQKMLDTIRSILEDFSGETVERSGVQHVSADKDVRMSKDITQDDVSALRSVGRKSVNEFTSEDIAKSEKWARIYYSDIGDKSPFFRAWFGDWRENQTEPVVKANIPSYENSNESRKQNRGDITNTDTGWIVRISREGETNTISHSGENRMSEYGLAGIRELMKNAVLLDTEVHEHHSNNAKNDMIAFDHKFYALGVSENGDTGLYKITVEDYFQSKKEPSNKRFHNLKYIEKIADNVGGRTFGQDRSGGSTNDISTTEYSIADLFSFVKKYDAEFKPKPASEIRNEDGTPKVMYHGTKEQFTVFDKKKAKSSGLYGKGFYFTGSESHSGQYGDSMAVYLDIKRPLSPDTDTVTEDQIRTFLEAVAENEDYSIENYGTYDVDEILDGITSRDMFGVLQDINATAIGNFVEAVELFNEVNGTEYDGIVVPTETVAFRANQIKSATDNVGTFDSGNADIRFSKEMDADYMAAVESDDMETAQRMVDDAAKAAGYITKKLYHGTSRFGFTTFDTTMNTASKGMIYATDRPEVAANYGGRNNYASRRKINKKLVFGDTVETVIHNAESVFGDEYHEATPVEREKVRNNIIKEGNRLAEEIDGVYDAVTSLPGFYDDSKEYSETPANYYDNVCGLVWTVTGEYEYQNDGSIEDVYFDDYKRSVERFEENYNKFRDYLNSVWENVPEKAKETLNKLVYGHELFDFYISVHYTMLPAIQNEDVVLTNGSRFVTKNELQNAIETVKDIGSYELYGNPGENILEVDAKNKDWMSIRVPEMGDGYYSTDKIGRWAKENGYSSVYVKNVYDGGINANEYIFFTSEQVKSADPVTYDDNGNVIPLSERFKDDNADIRFSKETRLAEENEYLKRQFVKRQGNEWAKAVEPKARRKYASKLAGELKGVSSSAIDAQLAKVWKVFEQPIRGGLDTMEVRYDEALKAAHEAAAELISGAKAANLNPLYEQYADLRKRLKDTAINPGSAKTDISDYSDWRKESMGVLRLSDKGTSVDGIWDELCGQYPEFFDASITDEAERIRVLADVANKLRAVPGNPMYVVDGVSPEDADAAIGEMETALAHSILSGYDLIAEETYAAKAEKERVRGENASAKAYANSMRDAENAQSNLENERIRTENAAKQAQAEAEGAILRYTNEAKGVLAKAGDAVIKAQNFEKKVWADFTREYNALQVSWRKANRAVETAQQKVIREKRKAEDARRRQELAAVRKNFMGNLTRIYNMTVDPTKNKHVPDEMREAVASLLEQFAGTRLPSGKTVDYNILVGIGEDAYANAEKESLGRMERIFGVIKQKNHSSDGGVTQNFIRDMENQIAMLRDMYSEINMRSADGTVMKPDAATTKNIEYLRQCSRILSMLDKYIRDMNVNFLAGKAVNAHEMAQSVVENLSKRKQESTDKFFSDVQYDFMTPETFLDRLGPIGREITKAYRRAQNRQAAFEQSYTDYMKTLTGGKYSTYDVGFNGKLVELAGNDGKILKVPKDQIMELYVLWNRPAAKRHIRNGGVYFLDEHGKENERLVVFDSGIEKVFDTLTEEDKRICDGIVRFLSTRCADWGNEASLYLYGYRKFGDTKYFPMNVSKDNLPETWASDGEFVRLENMGFTKKLKDSSSAPLRLGGIFNTADSHVRAMAAYSAYAPINNDVTRMVEMAGVRYNIEKYLGKRGWTYLSDFIRAVEQNKVRSGDNIAIAERFDKLGNAYKRAAVSWNISTAAKQPISMVRALNAIDGKYIAKAYADLMKHKEAVDAVGRMVDASGVAKMKVLGYSDVGFGKSLRQNYDDAYSPMGDRQKNMVLRNLAKAYEGFTDAGMWMAGKMDEATWARIWRACELETADKYKGLTFAEQTQKTAERFNEVIGQTQVVDTILDNAPILRSEKASMYTAFMSEPVKSLNSLIAAHDAMVEKRPGAKKQFGKAVGTLVVSNILLEPLVSIVFSMFRDDEDETDFETVTEKALNLWIGVPAGKDGNKWLAGEDGKKRVDELISDGMSRAKAEAKAKREYIWGDFGVDFISSQVFSALTGAIPYVSDLVDAVTNVILGYDNDRIDMANVSKAVRSTINLTKAYNGGGEQQKSLLNLWVTMLEDSAAIAGIPAKTFRRDLTAIYRTVLQATDSYNMQWELNKMLYNINSSTARTQKGFFDIMARAAKAGDTEAYKRMSDDLEEIIGSGSVGIKRSTITSQLEKRGYEPEIGSDIWYIDLQAGFDLDTFNTGMQAERMITDLYRKTKESSLLPKSPSDSFTVSGETVKISDPLEYQAFAEEVGDFSYMILVNMASSDGYKNLTDAQKQYAIEKAYDYARRRSRKRLYSAYDMGENLFKELYEKNAAPSSVASGILGKAKEKK